MSAGPATSSASDNGNIKHIEIEIRARERSDTAYRTITGTAVIRVEKKGKDG